MKASDGFTLVEMLVAIFVFAIIAAASLGIVSYGLDAKAATEAADARLAELQQMRALVKSDLSQVVPRPTRDAYGGAPGLLFTGQYQDRDEDVPILSFVRGGWENPGAALPRSGLQYVEYYFEDGVLYREARLFLDPVVSSEPERRAILSGIERFSLRFYNHPYWSDTAYITTVGSDALPQVVSMETEIAGIGHLRQLFMVGK